MVLEGLVGSRNDKACDGTFLPSTDRHSAIPPPDHHHIPRTHKTKTTELGSDEEIAEQAGGNLFTDTPEIRAWLLGVEKGKELVVGGTCVVACVIACVEGGWMDGCVY